jgi:hypothetical protein
MLCFLILHCTNQGLGYYGIGFFTRLGMFCFFYQEKMYEHSMGIEDSTLRLGGMEGTSKHMGNGYEKV